LFSSAGDYHLSAQSPAIDAGTDVAYRTISREAHNHVPDIGAYEYYDDQCVPSMAVHRLVCLQRRNTDKDLHRRKRLRHSEPRGRAQCIVVCVHDAEIEPCDGCVSVDELFAYVRSWRASDAVSLSSIDRGYPALEAGLLTKDL